jgi:hypothetical protein
MRAGVGCWRTKNYRGTTLVENEELRLLQRHLVSLECRIAGKDLIPRASIDI